MLSSGHAELSGDVRRLARHAVEVFGEDVGVRHDDSKLALEKRDGLQHAGRIQRARVDQRGVIFECIRWIEFRRDERSNRITDLRTQSPPPSLRSESCPAAVMSQVSK